MKRYNNLFDKITEIDNLYLAYNKAKRGKTWQSKVKCIADNLDYYMAKLRDSLANGEYRTSKYKTKQIFEPKERTIYILPFYPDRIVHHAVMNILEPILDGMFIYDSYACRKGKGQHAGSRKCMAYVRRNRYCLQCDISKFYPSVDHEILKSILARKFKDERLLKLLYEIIDSAGGGKNVPIGNYLSQWFGNLYLNELDMFLKHDLRVKDYIRYCDDFCVFANDKKYLQDVADGIERFLQEKLLLKLSRRRIYPTAQGVDFLGYRHFPKYILVRKRTAKRIKKHLAEVFYLLKRRKITKGQAVSKIASAKGWLRHAQTHHLKLALDIGNLEKEVAAYGR